MTEPLPRFDAVSEDAPLKEALRAAIGRVLDRGIYLKGPETAGFEAEFTRRLDSSGARGGVGVGSGTDAITLALLALGVGPGDEVVTVANAGLAGPTAVRRTGADVIFCDVTAETLLMDPASAAMVCGPRTRAILPVHLYGNVVDIEALRASVGDIPIVEDCAQAFGSRLRGRAVGTLGDAAAFSFYPTKNLGGLGDAGFVAGPSALVDRTRELADYGRRRDGVAAALGMMSRMDELHAATLRVKLAGFDGSLARRQALCAHYDAALPLTHRRVGRDLAGETAIHLYVLRVPARAMLRARLKDAGIDVGVHYPVPAHHMAPFADGARVPLPASERGCEEVISLPFYPSMADDAVTRVCTALEAAT